MYTQGKLPVLWWNVFFTPQTKRYQRCQSHADYLTKMPSDVHGAPRPHGIVTPGLSIASVPLNQEKPRHRSKRELSSAQEMDFPPYSFQIGRAHV